MKNYVKEYKGYKVPEGATHAGFGRRGCNDGFYKNCLGFTCFFPAGGDEWSTVELDDFVAIELPLAEEEFTPEVGFHGECNYAGKVLECVVVINNRVCIFGNGFETITEIVDGMNIRPIKPERDKFIERSLGLDCDPMQGMLSRVDFVGAMYDNGARFMDGDG